MSDMKSTRAVVVGASRGFGRGVAEALVRAGAEVHALSRSDSSELVRATDGQVHTIAADATDPEVALRVLREVKPNVVVLNAEARDYPRAQVGILFRQLGHRREDDLPLDEGYP